MSATPHDARFDVPVTDVLVSVQVSLPDKVWEKHHRSYFVWEYGKVPDVVIEIVSNREGGELSDKLRRYARMRIPELGLDLLPWEGTFERCTERARAAKLRALGIDPDVA